MQEEKVKLIIPGSIIEERKNEGSLGKVCEKCKGFGFSMKLKGGRTVCKECAGSGIGYVDVQNLYIRVGRLEADNSLLRKALLETLKNKNISIKTDIKE